MRESSYETSKSLKIDIWENLPLDSLFSAKMKVSKLTEIRLIRLIFCKTLSFLIEVKDITDIAKKNIGARSLIE
jgi:hypothetical protein